MIVTQDYGWSQLAKRQGMLWPQATDWAMDQARRAGFDGWEPYLNAAEVARRIGRRVAAHGMAMPSVFVSGDLISDGGGEMDRMVAAASAAADFGAVSGPRSWGRATLTIRPSRRPWRPSDASPCWWSNMPMRMERPTRWTRLRRIDKA